MRDDLNMNNLTVIEAEIDADIYEQAVIILTGWHISMEDYLSYCFVMMVEEKEQILKKYHSGVCAEDIMGDIAQMVLDALLGQNKWEGYEKDSNVV